MSSEQSVPKPFVNLAAITNAHAGGSVNPTAESKPDGFGTTPPLVARPNKHALARRSYRKLLRFCSRFATTLRRDKELARTISADLNGFRADLERAMRSQFPLRRGRPTDPMLDAACRMVGEGKSVSEVLRSQIKDWDTLDTYTRYLLSKGLRQAVARRRKGTRNAAIRNEMNG